MKPRIVADIHPYEQQQKVAVYRDNNENDIYTVTTDSLVQEIGSLYNKEQACQLTLLGSKRFNKRLQSDLEENVPAIRVVII